MQLAVEPGVGARVKAQAQHEKDAEFEAYMAARQPSLLRTAYLISGDRHTAEDLVQTALAKLYLSWDKVHDRQMIDGYVRRIIVNEHNSLWRRAWKKRELSTDTLPDHQTVTHEHDHGQRDALWGFVQTLPRKQRAVIVLRYYEDLSEAEIAETLGISVGTVKSQASRALAAMRSRVHDNPVLAQGVPGGPGPSRAASGVGDGKAEEGGGAEPRRPTTTPPAPAPGVAQQAQGSLGTPEDRAPADRSATDREEER